MLLYSIYMIYFLLSIVLILFSLYYRLSGAEGKYTWIDYLLHRAFSFSGLIVIMIIVGVSLYFGLNEWNLLIIAAVTGWILGYTAMINAFHYQNKIEYLEELLFEKGVITKDEQVEMKLNNYNLKRKIND